jgi:imidazolonepropionase-like amidohydrolase
LRDRQRGGEIGGAEIFASGPCFTATKGHCSEYGIPTRIIDSPADVQKQLAELAPKRPDVIKVVYDHGQGTLPSIDRATLEALVAGARERGLKTIVHVGTWEDVRQAVLAGAAALTHVARDGPVPDDVVSLMAKQRTIHIPTLTVHTDMQAFTESSALLDSPLMAALTTDAIRNAYRKAPALSPEQMARRRANVERAIAAVRRLHAAGIPMLTGTDAGNLGVIQGYSVHREMSRLVEAGLTPWEALSAATTGAGEFLGRRYGVRMGDAANLVVLDASPLEDIANTQRISLVVMRGQVAYRR